MRLEAILSTRKGLIERPPTQLVCLPVYLSTPNFILFVLSHDRDIVLAPENTPPGESCMVVHTLALPLVDGSTGHLPTTSDVWLSDADLDDGPEGG